MGILNMLLGLKDIEVKGNQQVHTLRKNFKDSFGAEIRVYKHTKDGKINTGKGARPADEKATLAKVSIQKVEDITIKKSHTVGDIEKQFKSKVGIGIQIEQPDGSLAPDNMRLKDVANMAG
jgi:hypothetical protein